MHSDNEMTRNKLLQAEKIAIQLFEAVEERHLIVPGISEEQLNAAVADLALKNFGIEKHWHKKIVRAGINTVAQYPDNPDNRILMADDIVFIDYGPIVEGYEADIGRTYVIGDDAKKIKLKNDVEQAWYEIQSWFENQSTVKASDLFTYVQEKALAFGWLFGGQIAGHIVGQYPHEQPADPKSVELDVHPQNDHDMFVKDKNGCDRHWILELQFTDVEKTMGGYFEQLL